MLHLSGNLYCEQSEHEGEAPAVLLLEGATRAPLIVSLRKGLSRLKHFSRCKNNAKLKIQNTNKSIQRLYMEWRTTNNE
jgi:hypothetical protein